MIRFVTRWPHLVGRDGPSRRRGPDSDGSANRPCLALVLGLLAAAVTANGQSVLTPPPQVPVTPPAVQEIESEKAGYIDFGDAVPGVPQNVQPFLVGPIVLHPHVSYQFLYANGIQSGPGVAHSSIIQNVSPGLTVALGKNLTLDYTGTWTLYSNPAFQNSYNQSASLQGGYRYGDWVLGLSQTYNRSDSTLIQTAQQTEQETYSTGLTGSYHFNSVLSVDLSANQTFTYYNMTTNTFANTQSWSTMDWLNYQFWPRLDASVGVGGGFDDVSVGPNDTYEMYQARVGWRATDKIGFQVHGGMEDLQFLNSGIGDLVTPIYGANIGYKPFQFTALSFDANRAVSTSPFEDEDTESTSLTGSLNQRLLKKLYLNVSGGYSWVTYVASSTALAVNRRDQGYTVGVNLSWTFLERGTAALTYQNSENSSTLPGYAFRSDQYGFTLGYRY